MLFTLFITFFKIGLFTFGGGYAMIPLLTEEALITFGMTESEILNFIAVAESTPGPIAVNCATFTGYKKAGVLGALVATLGMVVPSFIVIFLISKFLDNFMEITLIANAFKGIKVAVGVLILDAAVTMIKKMSSKILARIIMICSCVAMLCINVFAWNFSSISLMVIAGIVNLTVFVSTSKITKEGGDRQ